MKILKYVFRSIGLPVFANAFNFLTFTFEKCFKKSLTKKMKIALLADTHNFLNEKIYEYIRDCDEIWHAGDFGTIAIADQLAAVKPLVGVYGNIDGQDVRIVYPENQVFEREHLKIWMTHIGGYPPKYKPGIKKQLDAIKPDIFVCGHSHILKVVRDQERNKMLCINPGAAGKQGFQKVSTFLTFHINAGKVSNMQVIELDKQ